MKLASQLAAQADLQEAEVQEGVSNFEAQLAAATAAADKAKSLNAKLLLARARIMQCGALLNAGKADEAKPKCDEARQINEPEGDALCTARATNGVANAIWRQGDHAAAKALYELGKAQAIGDRRAEARALNIWRTFAIRRGTPPVLKETIGRALRSQKSAEVGGSSRWRSRIRRCFFTPRGNEKRTLPRFSKPSKSRNRLETGKTRRALWEARIALSEAQYKAGRVAEARATLAVTAREAKTKCFALLAKRAGHVSQNFWEVEKMYRELTPQESR